MQEHKTDDCVKVFMLPQGQKLLRILLWKIFDTLPYNLNKMLLAHTVVGKLLAISLYSI